MIDSGFFPGGRLIAATFSMNTRMKHRPSRPAPRALPTPTATALGDLIVRHAGPLSADLLLRNVETGSRISELSLAIIDQDDALSREAALKIAYMDPGHPDAVQLIRILDGRTLN